METGAVIERGRVLAAEAGAYTVASLDRDGIQSLPIGALSDNTYTVGDTVYFFIFPDGTGKIISGA